MVNSKISVIMPVHNGAEFIEDSIKSVLNQSYSNFELIIVNDGSTDRSAEVVRSIKDNRIKLAEHFPNRGAAAARNVGLSLATGEYIALLDSDDLARPDRFATQVNFLEKNNYHITGSWAQPFNGSNNATWTYPSNPEILKARILFDCPFATSTILLRKSFLLKNNFQFDENPALRISEDYDLWERISRITTLHNVPEILIDYRFHQSQSTSGSTSKDQVLSASKIIQQRQLDLLGIEATQAEINTHVIIGLQWCSEIDKVSLENIIHWFNKIIEANKKTKVFYQAALEQVILERWIIACRNMNSKTTYWDLLNQFPLFRESSHLSLYRKLKLIVRSYLLTTKSK